ncbi:calponin homology (CH) domain-containing protein [Ditylenchus destructor]|uniref:Calponin homology (CH) domain-containing protein n=1 Tax=Ditylenchus destructor TaxID=166010 RepID=A0AAD4NCE1_9BILA|nr:calponin homology (CH) domain-containing protein [Ditylenchus destructor]
MLNKPNLHHRGSKPATSTFVYSHPSNGHSAPGGTTNGSMLNSPCSSISSSQQYSNGGVPQRNGTAHSVSSSGVSTPSTVLDNAESECLEHYELNLEKYKDERDAVQKKTFTKWVNKHLTKSGRKVDDLFRDLQDGFNLIALLEALSDETLHRENGYTRFHRIQNIQYCLDFLRRKHIKLVNIRPEDIVEGNGKLTLGLIWTIILNFQISKVIQHPQPSTTQIVKEHISRSTTEEIVRLKNGHGPVESYAEVRKVGWIFFKLKALKLYENFT